MIAAAARNAFRALVFVCVCASLWQAPLPWLHHHCAQPDRLSDPQLALHLQRLHSRSSACESGWHWHFVMLDDIVRGAGLPAPPAEGETPVLPKAHVVLGNCVTAEIVAHVLPGPSVVAIDQLATLAPQVNPQGRRQIQFLSELASARRLHLVLGVVRC